MHVRLNYVDLRPELMEELKAFWRERVGGYKGMAKGHLLLDGIRSLSVVLFDTEANMNENTKGALQGVAKDATRFRLSEPEVFAREMAGEVKGAPGTIGYARVADVVFKKDKIAEAVATWPQQMAAYRKEPGFRSAYLCLDRKTGEAASVSFWGSKADVEANEKSGAFKSAIGGHEAFMAGPPKRSAWPWPPGAN